MASTTIWSNTKITRRKKNIHRIFIFRTKIKSGFWTFYNLPIDKERKTICNGLSKKLSLSERASHLMILFDPTAINNLFCWCCCCRRSCFFLEKLSQEEKRDFHGSLFWSSLSLFCVWWRKEKLGFLCLFI